MRKMSEFLQEEKVSVLLDSSLDYPEKVPFYPPSNYPELTFKDKIDKSNRIYPAIRKIFISMGLDKKHYGTSAWSPLSQLVEEGGTVFIKPNLVYHSNLSGDSVFAVITHPSLIRAIIDYAYKAVGDNGKIIVADAPQHNADFQKIMEITGLKETVEYLRSNFSVPVELYDLRKEYVVYKDGVIVKRVALSGDPKGYVKVDLGKESMLTEIDLYYKRFYGADYDRKETMSYHNPGHHIYVISRTLLESDLVINLPKLKTHMKAGITCALKNMIGIIGEKNCLVHYRIGSPLKGGDEYSEPESKRVALLLRLNRLYSDIFLSRGLGINLYRAIIRLSKTSLKFKSESGRASSIIYSGNWNGNDTIWRTTLDVNKIAAFADREGQVHDTPQRQIINIVDGIIGGEGQGPLAPKAKRCGSIICGYDPFKVDLIATRLMSFDEQKIPIFKHIKPNNFSTILIKDEVSELIEDSNYFPSLKFEPPKAWGIMRNNTHRK